MRGLRARVWFSYCFNFERNCDVLKSKSSWFLLNKNINFNKNDGESKMENPTQFWRDEPCASKLKVKFWWVVARERKKRAFFVTFILSEGNFFKHLCFMLMYSVLNKLSEYIYSYILKNYTSYTFVACF